MARRSSPTPSKRRAGPNTGPVRRKPCIYCKANAKEVDYKAYNTLRSFTSEKGKIKAKRVTHLCRRHQSQLAVAIKRAREVALLPYLGQ